MISKIYNCFRKERIISTSKLELESATKGATSKLDRCP